MSQDAFSFTHIYQSVSGPMQPLMMYISLIVFPLPLPTRSHLLSCCSKPHPPLLILECLVLYVLPPPLNNTTPNLILGRANVFSLDSNLAPKDIFFLILQPEKFCCLVMLFFMNIFSHSILSHPPQHFMTQVDFQDFNFLLESAMHHDLCFLPLMDRSFDTIKVSEQ